VMFVLVLAGTIAFFAAAFLLQQGLKITDS